MQLLYNTCHITPSLHKTFQQIYLILKSIDFIVYIIFHTIFHNVTLIYSGGKFKHINKFETCVRSVDCSLSNY